MQHVLLVRVELCQTTRHHIPGTVIAKVDEHLENPLMFGLSEIT